MKFKPGPRLSKSHNEINNLVRRGALSGEMRSGGATHLLVGGDPDDKRTTLDEASAAGHLTRDDGTWLAFSISVKEEQKGLELKGYRFILKFPPEKTWRGLQFLRFDWELDGKKHEPDGLRVHLHPGHKDLRIPVPWMTPAEVLRLLLFGLHAR